MEREKEDDKRMGDGREIGGRLSLQYFTSKPIIIFIFDIFHTHTHTHSTTHQFPDWARNLHAYCGLLLVVGCVMQKESVQRMMTGSLSLSSFSP